MLPAGLPLTPSLQRAAQPASAVARTATAGVPLPQKAGPFTLVHWSQRVLHQMNTKQNRTNSWPWYLFFLDNFSFCVWQLEEKCMCHIHIDQQSGGCLYIIQEIKGWRHFILIWGQQNQGYWGAACMCSSAMQIKANARLHWGAAELTKLRSSNTSLVIEAQCRTCVDIP